MQSTPARLLTNLIQLQPSWDGHCGVTSCWAVAWRCHSAQSPHLHRPVRRVPWLYLRAKLDEITHTNMSATTPIAGLDGPNLQYHPGSNLRFKGHLVPVWAAERVVGELGIWGARSRPSSDLRFLLTPLHVPHSSWPAGKLAPGLASAATTIDSMYTVSHCACHRPHQLQTIINPTYAVLTEQI
jgi:hypothetical protein